MSKAVSTHSRPKAAGFPAACTLPCRRFQHTAARRRLQFRGQPRLLLPVSTHSRPKAAVRPWLSARVPARFQHTAARRRLLFLLRQGFQAACFNTQPPEGGWHSRRINRADFPFQHTAARRRLAQSLPNFGSWVVSTHSRPKAAGHCRRHRDRAGRFNTQPPEGG